MDSQTQLALAGINREFYDAEARSFSATRNHAWPGWKRVTDRFAGCERISVLDVGCGNGRFLDHLRELDLEIDYTGCDVSEGLLEEARQRHPTSARIRFVAGDLVASDPAARSLAPVLPDRGPEPGFDLIAVFGVLHHIPGLPRRRALLEALAQRLAPGGLLALTFWRFATSPRFAKRIVAWEEYNRATDRPVALDQLESGDHLLRWGDGEGPPRYCHFVNDGELERLLESLPVEGHSLSVEGHPLPVEGLSPSLDEIDRFEADGRSGDLNRYVVLRRPEHG